ncbi:unnamed protein product [Gongylonema pulchrum]|uniref:Carboxypeptidase n=1 Tax=Gongylonema pulchrum TaxID=637853 RepID=A0A183EQ99_9BILA|nr:unnamed protein product [Gongylonema pulchrum]
MKYPQFADHRVFIMGESYGAVYTTTMLEHIIDNATEFPIKIEVPIEH